MPVNIPDSLPASDILRKENVFVMNKTRAERQDIRPLRIAILNLMPVKITTETHLIRMLSNTPLQIELNLLFTSGHVPKNTPSFHLDAFYKTFDEIKHLKYDGLIVTGAPIEHLEFEDVHYWDELTHIFDWAKTNVTSTLHICWGAQAGLYYNYGIKKVPLEKKLFGIFKHTVQNKTVPLVRGFDDVFFAPHSRHTENTISDIENTPGLEVVCSSEKAGAYIIASTDNKNVFVSGHSEYDLYTLKEEYVRDKKKGLDIEMPENYFEDDDESKEPINRWKAHGALLFTNWLNFYVYQETPY